MPYAKLIINPVAGAGKSYKYLPSIINLLKEIGYDFDYSITDAPGHATRIAKSAATEGYKVVVSVGGDGTINEIMNGLYESGYIDNIILGIINMGTGADYIRTVGIPRDYRDACKRVVNPRILRVDLGKVQCVDKDKPINRLFINFAGLGIDAEIVKAVTVKYKVLGSQAAYLIGLLMTLITYNNNNMTLTIDNVSEHLKVCTVIMGIGKYGGGGMMTTPNAVINDGLFDILVINNMDKFDLIKSLPRIYKGTHLTHPKVRVQKSSEVTIIPDQIMSIQADGEIIGQSPCSFSVLPKILSVAI